MIRDLTTPELRKIILDVLKPIETVCGKVVAESVTDALITRLCIPPPAAQEYAWLEQVAQRARARSLFDAADIARLRRLANWADCPPPPTWGGTVDLMEVLSAVEVAKSLLKARNP